jgi:hypothetical protein
MSEVDRDALKRSIEALRSRPSRHRARRNIQPELSAITTQSRTDMVEILEGAATQAGIDVRKLRATLARHQKNAVDDIAALRSQAAATEHSGAVTSLRFQSLRALAGRAVPLDQPSSLTFLSKPVNITANEVGGSYLVASSLAPTFVQTMVGATGPDHSGEYTFWYSWFNNSAMPALAQVSTALELNGNLFAQAVTFCGDDSVDCYIDGGINIGFSPNDLITESRSYHFATLGAKATFIGLDTKTTFFDNDDHGMSMDGFIVPPNTELVISVWVEFSFDFSAAGEGNSSVANADFASDGNSVSVPGVVLITTPVQIVIQ